MFKRLRVLSGDTLTLPNTKVTKAFITNGNGQLIANFSVNNGVWFLPPVITSRLNGTYKYKVISEIGTIQFGTMEVL
ncbi:TPA: hypothetical protein PMC50_002507 [Vibrio cholerae]|nr:hypothetical protein [Vibrio cholerae]